MIFTDANNKTQEELTRVRELRADIVGIWRRPDLKMHYEVILSAYLLSKISAYNEPLHVMLKDLKQGVQDIPQQIGIAAAECMQEDLWDQLKRLVTRYDQRDFTKVAFLEKLDTGREFMETPESVLMLAHEILKVQPSDRVADMGCGCGSYTVSAYEKCPEAAYYGCDINADSSNIALMRADLLGKNVRIELRDMFDLADDNNIPRFTKIFANYPFGRKTRDNDRGRKYLEKLPELQLACSRAASLDWIFNLLLCDLLDKKGKAIAIMTNSSACNRIDTPMRKYFVDQGLVECVISLPARMFAGTNVSTAMIVFSHGNKAVRLVDASEICTQGRRYNEFSQSDIQKIMKAMQEDGPWSKEISQEELSENDYVLSLSRYAAEKVNFRDGVPFETVIKSITRGAPITAGQLDEMASEEETNMQYLMIADIKDGVIAKDLPYLSYIDKKHEKYCIQNNNLILAKNSYPYKVAVATVAEGHKLLANGNLYVIEVDGEKAHPLYLKGFFESEAGIAVLKSITVGATIPNIGVEQLKKVQIPLPSMEEQLHMVQKYQRIMEEITEFNLQLQKAREQLHHVFDEAGAE